MTVMAGKFLLEHRKMARAGAGPTRQPYSKALQLPRTAPKGQPRRALSAQRMGLATVIFKSEQKWNRQPGAARVRRPLRSPAPARRCLKLGSVDHRSADTAGQLLPGSLRILGKPHELEIRRRDHPGVKERVEIDDLRPIAAVDTNQGNQPALARLHER